MKSQERSSPEVPAVEPYSDGCLIRVKVRPQQGRFRVVSVEDSFVKINLKSAPENNRANEELVKELSRIFSTTASLVSGKKSKLKTVYLKGVSPEQAASRFLQLVS